MTEAAQESRKNVRVGRDFSGGSILRGVNTAMLFSGVFRHPASPLLDRAVLDIAPARGEFGFGSFGAVLNPSVDVEH